MTILMNKVVPKLSLVNLQYNFASQNDWIERHVLSVTCCDEHLFVPDGSPAVVVLLSRGCFVRWVSEEACDSEQAVGVFQGAGEPVVVLPGPQRWPANMDARCAVPTQLTLQLLSLHSLQVSPQVQFRDYNTKDYIRKQ